MLNRSQRAKRAAAFGPFNNAGPGCVNRNPLAFFVTQSRVALDISIGRRSMGRPVFSGDAGPASQHAEELTALDTAPPEGMYWAQVQGLSTPRPIVDLERSVDLGGYRPRAPSGRPIVDLERSVDLGGYRPRALSGRPIVDLERSVDLGGYRPRALSGRPARSTLEQQRASLSDPDSQWLSHVLSQSARVAFATPVGDTMLEEAGMAADSMRADGFPRGGLDAGGLSLKETGMAAFLAEANAALDRMPSFNSTTSSEEEAVEAGVKMEVPSVARIFSGASETASVSTARPSEIIEEEEEEEEEEEGDTPLSGSSMIAFWLIAAGNR
eukprot:scaffold6416_cov66-Phaeocystis_antarctica.AAC.1